MVQIPNNNSERFTECYRASKVVFTWIVAFHCHNKPEGKLLLSPFQMRKTWVLRMVQKCVQSYTTKMWNRDFKKAGYQIKQLLWAHWTYFQFWHSLVVRLRHSINCVLTSVFLIQKWHCSITSFMSMGWGKINNEWKPISCTQKIKILSNKIFLIFYSFNREVTPEKQRCWASQTRY